MPVRDPSLFKSIKRTLVPVIVGAVLALATSAGFDLPEGSLTEVITAIYTGVYYTVLRWLEPRFEWAGTLLGGKGGPSYAPKEG